jgi:hypothetical protein
MIVPALGVLAGLAGIANAVPYIRDTVRGTTRPHRGTWLIWGTLAVVVFLSQRAGGASWSLIMACTQAALTGAVLFLALAGGEGRINGRDAALIAVGGGGVVGWIVAGDPLVGWPASSPPICSRRR